MLRSKGLTEKVLLLGVDGMDPRFSRKMIDEGYMPNLKKLVENGSARNDLRMLGANPTITPPMWTTLATGAYPMTHGVEDFNIGLKGELDVNFAGIYSKYVHAEQLWNVTAESGKKTLVWHWPGGAWPPSSDSPNLYVVDGTSPGALGFCYAQRDTEYVVVASTKTPEAAFYGYATYSSSNLTGDPNEVSHTMLPLGNSQQSKKDYHDELWKEFSEGIACNGYKPKRYMDFRLTITMPGDKVGMNMLYRFPQSVAFSPIVEPQGWGFDVPEGAKEMTLKQLYGAMEKPCLILKNAEGKYDKVAIYGTKAIAQPIVVLEPGVNNMNVPDVVPKGRSGELENVVRYMKLLNIAEDGTYVRFYCSMAYSADDNTVWYPTWVFDKIKAANGPPVPCGQFFGGDRDLAEVDIYLWDQVAKWQAKGIKYMIDNEGVEVVFSHFHGPDMSGHTYMQWLKNRPAAENEACVAESVLDESEVYKMHIATYKMTDDYLGEFLPYLDEGWTIFVFSDHSLICKEENQNHMIGDNMGVNTGIMYELGYTALQKDENGNLIPEIDWENTKAIQQRSNSIFINLKGRDRFGIVDPVDKYELEEQIITDLYGYRDKTTGHRVVSMALHAKDANLLGLGGEYTAGDIIFFIHDDYCNDHGEGLSTVCGHADTTLSPIFVACGQGVKKGFEMKLFPREVDLAPTVAVLLGVRIPAECEGSPAYTIFTEEM